MNLRSMFPLVREHRFVDLRRTRETGTAARRVPLLIWTDRANAGDAPLANFHHDFFSLYLVRRGRGTHSIDGAKYAIARGDVYAMAPGMAHHFVDCENLLTDTLHFSPDVFDAATLDALTDTPGFWGLFVTRDRTHTSPRWLRLTPEQFDDAVSIVEELKSEWQAATASGDLLVPGLFLRLLVRLSRMADTQGTTITPTSTHETTIARALAFMNAHFAENIRVEQVAAHVFLSAHRFTEVFGAAMGRTPRDYLRHLRVEHAKTLLRTTELPLADVAVRAGLNDGAYLTRVLRLTTGQTPSQIRKSASVAERVSRPSGK